MVRFPIDRGAIRVTCACGNSFLADPDDTALYEGARFDLASPGPKKKRSNNMPPGKTLRTLVDRGVRRGYDLAYRFQNFFLLPTREQIKLAAGVLLFLGALFLLCYLVCAPGPCAISDGAV